MRAGLLTEQITFQVSEVVKDSFGATVRQWRNILTTRANVTYDSGYRANENNEIVYGNSITFTARYYHQITEQMVIMWHGKKYRILSINREKQKQNVTIKTELINE